MSVVTNLFLFLVLIELYLILNNFFFIFFKGSIYTINIIF